MKGTAFYRSFLRSNKRGGTLRLYLVLIACLGFFGLLALFLQYDQLKKTRSFRPYRSALFLPRKEYAKALAFGYDTFMADFHYLRSIQAFGGQWRTAVKNYESVYHFFDAIVALDPHFIEAYEFGSMVIGEEGGDPEAAIELNRTGWLKNRQTYKLAYWNAYIAGWTMHDMDRAKYWAIMATKAPDCPEHIERLIRYFDKELGRFNASLERWIHDYIRAARGGMEHSDYMIGIATEQMQDIIHKWNKKILHDATKKYYDEKGELPSDLQALVEQGYLDNYENADYFVLMRELKMLELTGLALPGTQQAIYNKAVRTRSGVPRPPEGERPGEARYYLRKDLKPELIDAFFENETLIVSTKEAREFNQRLLAYLRGEIEKYHAEQEAWPASVDDVIPKGSILQDPLGKPWDYNAETGELKSKSFPEL